MIKFILTFLLVFTNCANFAHSQSGSKIPEEYEPSAYQTIIADLERRLYSLEGIGSETIVSEGEPRGANGLMWFKPSQQQLYAYIGNEWVRVVMEGDPEVSPAPELNGYVETVGSATTWTVGHKLNSNKVFVQIWEGGTVLMYPDSIAIDDRDTVKVYFETATAGEIAVIAMNTDYYFEVTAATEDVSTAATSWDLRHALDSKKLLAQIWENKTSLLLADLNINHRDSLTATFAETVKGKATIAGVAPLRGMWFYSEDFTSTDTVEVLHKLNTDDMVVQVWDSGTDFMIPTSITITDRNTVTVIFETDQSGRIVIVPIS